MTTGGMQVYPQVNRRNTLLSDIMLRTQRVLVTKISATGSNKADRVVKKACTSQPSLFVLISIVGAGALAADTHSRWEEAK